MTEEKKDSKIISCGDTVVAETHEGIIVGKVQSRVEHANDLTRYQVQTVNGRLIEVFTGDILWNKEEILLSINERRDYVHRRL